MREDVNVNISYCYTNNTNRLPDDGTLQEHDVVP